MSQVTKTKKCEIYSDQKVQLLINKFNNQKIKKIEPVFDHEYGYRYPVIEAIVGSPNTVRSFLNHLLKKGILEREIYDKVLHCPKCDSINVSVRYRCPYCKTYNIKKRSLIEHISCGYIDVENKFQKDNELVCSKCNKKLTEKDKDFRKAGVWCTCNECEKSFHIPTTSHFCRVCHTNFMFEDANLKDLYSYSLSNKTLKEASLGWIMIAPVKDFLQKQEYQVEIQGCLKGTSGAKHMFDIIAVSKVNPNKRVVFDFAVSDEGAVNEQPIIAMFAKIYDVSPEKAIVIAIPKINENAKKLASLYKIDLIEANESSKILETLKTVIKKP